MTTGDYITEIQSVTPTETVSESGTVATTGNGVSTEDPFTTSPILTGIYRLCCCEVELGWVRVYFMLCF